MFPPVKDKGIVEEELGVRRRDYRNSIKDLLNRIPTRILVTIMNDVVDRATGVGSRHAPQLIEDLVNVYEIEAQGFVEAEAKNLEALIGKSRAVVTQGESAVAPVVEAIRTVAENSDQNS